jgi:release factor glutamine methyltransferase
LFWRRIRGEPIAYITGQREFYGLSFQVTPDVLIPRPETELLVDLTLERLLPTGSVLDLGTGSGAIAVAIAHACPEAKVTALDVSPAALAVAHGNAVRILADRAVQLCLLSGDWYAPLAEHDRFDVIVANPPYIAAADAHLAQGDLRFEPSGALTDRADGLSALRTIIDGAPSHLHPGGWLLLEHGYDQAEKVRNLLKNKGFIQVQSWCDLAGIERVSGGLCP